MARKLRIPRLEPSGTRAYLRAYEKPRTSSTPYSVDDRGRKQREPWRKDGYGRAYREERQRVIQRQQGRCADCGRQVATWKDGRWTGGEVHHEKPLRAGGGHEAGNLVLLCPACHHRRDAARRRREKGL